jgi:tetratricopeptide (TPR) repeat protein
LKQNRSITGRGSLFFLTLFIGLYVPAALAEVKDLVRFEVAKKYYRQGDKYFNTMQYLAAAEYFRKAVNEYPDYYTARDFLARSYKLAGFNEAALKEWENLLEVSPDNAALINKIDDLRFQEIKPDTEYGRADYVYQDTYVSPKIKRYEFRRPVGIAVDNDKSVYITSFSEGNLVKLDSNGKGVFSIKVALSGKLYGVAHYRGRLAVADFKNDRIYFLNKKGEVLGKFGASGEGEGQFHGPEGICFNEKGELYVVDSGNCRVQKFDEKGAYILQFGKRGEYEGELQKPTDVAAYRDRVYVTDTGNRRIACFDDSGNFVNNIILKELEYPRGMTRAGDSLLLSDEKKGLLFYDPQTGITSRFNPSGGPQNGVSRPVSAIMDRDSYLYCLDHDRESVVIYSPSKKRYSNLSVETTSIDVNSFPTVAFYLTIRSRDGSPLYGLDATNFQVTEDGAPITNVYIDYLKKLLPSVSISLCVDRSRRNEQYHGDIPWVAEFILQKMRKNDSIKVINFNKEYWVGNKFDWSRRRTLKALREREYGEGKNMGKALYNAVSDVASRLNRRGVVLITDGSANEDSFQTYTPGNIVSYAKTHYVPIYIISFKEPHELLKTIAAETGGAVFRPGQLDGMRTIYSKIKSSEEYRYVLVYPTFKLPSFKGLWSDVRIEVNHKGQKGVEWGGYFVP